eukprot:scaffold316366_cov18-Tisochrysis_lutea.AAC.2
MENFNQPRLLHFLSIHQTCATADRAADTTHAHSEAQSLARNSPVELMMPALQKTGTLQKSGHNTCTCNPSAKPAAHLIVHQLFELHT